MGILRTLILGRRDGLRARIRRRVLSLFAQGDRQSATAVEEPAEPARSLIPEPPRGVVPPAGFEVVLHRDALKPGQIREVIVAGKAIAVANVDGEIHALTNSCPHAENPLGEGTLHGSVVTCPGHGWRFDVVTGACLTNPEVSVERYEVHVQDEAICVRV